MDQSFFTDIFILSIFGLVVFAILTFLVGIFDLSNKTFKSKIPMFGLGLFLFSLVFSLISADLYDSLPFTSNFVFIGGMIVYIFIGIFLIRSYNRSEKKAKIEVRNTTKSKKKVARLKVAGLSILLLAIVVIIYVFWALSQLAGL